RLVRMLRAGGFDFVRVSDLAGLPERAVEVPATRWQRVRGELLTGTLLVSRWLTETLAVMLAVVALLFVARVVAVLAFARRHVRTSRRDSFDGSFAPPVSIVVPAFNEATGIERAVGSLACSDYPVFEIVVVDDGSEDGTAELVEGLDLERVSIVRQTNAGKSAA